MKSQTTSFSFQIYKMLSFVHNANAKILYRVACWNEVTIC